jgi:hypothetical protein
VELVPADALEQLVREGAIDHALVVAAFGLLMLQPQLARGASADTR